MPALYPGGGVSYLDLYGELTQLGFAHGRDFHRRNGGQMGWYFEASDEAYQAWIAKRGATPQPPVVETPDPEPQKNEPVTEPDVSDTTAETAEDSVASTQDSRASTQRRSAKKGR